MKVVRRRQMNPELPRERRMVKHHRRFNGFSPSLTLLSCFEAQIRFWEISSGDPSWFASLPWASGRRIIFVTFVPPLPLSLSVSLSIVIFVVVVVSFCRRDDKLSAGCMLRSAFFVGSVLAEDLFR